MGIIHLRKQGFLRAGLVALLAVGGLHHDAWSQDTASRQSANPATEPKVILEVEESNFGVWRTGDQWSQPKLLLRVFSDGTAEPPSVQSDKTKKRTTLTQDQFDKFRSFLDQPDLLALKDPSCGNSGYDSVSTTTIVLYHRERKQVVSLSNFSPRGGYGSHWPEQCPKIVVKLQCTVEGLLAGPDGKTSHWHEDCTDILAH
jgi:hypothetical protein